MQVTFAEIVEDDLDSIAGYIAQDSPHHAFQLLERFAQEFQTIGHNPHIYRLRPEIGREARAAIVGNYLVLFRILQDCVRIERVVHGHRDLDSLLH